MLRLRYRAVSQDKPSDLEFPSSSILPERRHCSADSSDHADGHPSPMQSAMKALFEWHLRHHLQAPYLKRLL